MKNLYLLISLLFSAVSLFAQQKDSRTREYLSPTRIVWQQEEALITGVEHLLRPGTGQSDLTNKYICKIISTDKQHPALLLDFGKELQGGLQIVTGMPKSHEPIAIRVRFGESVSEAMCDIDGKNGATNDHAMRDFIVRLPWLGVTEVGNSGFRFVRIDLLDDSTELHLKEVRAISTYRDIPYKGSFRSNDERLNNIWQTGAYTVHLNMQEYLWDGIKRDRLVWIGDMYPEVMTINAVFGYNEVVPKSLDFAKDITPLPNWMNGYSAYSISWLLIQYDWYRHHGNLDYLKKQKSYITGLMKQFISCIGEDGVEKLTGGRFLDWPSSANKPAIQAGLQAFMIWAMRAGEELCRDLGEEELAKECAKSAKRLVAAAPKASEAFLKSDLAHDAPGQKQAAALMALTGLMDKGKANQEYLSYNGSHGFSTFFGFFMLEAMAAANNYQGAMNVIREYWGAMLDLGATTFWEDFNMKWLPNAAPIDEIVPEGKKDIHGDYGDYCYKGFRHSLCHGWASGPTYWLSRHVLGICPMEPGFKTVSIRPNLGDLEWVEGTYPTPYGEIKVRHEKGADGKVKSQIEVPEGVKVVK